MYKNKDKLLPLLFYPYIIFLQMTHLKDSSPLNLVLCSLMYPTGCRWRNSIVSVALNCTTEVIMTEKGL